MSRLAKRYEKLYPGTDCSNAQKEERMQRIDFRSERREHKRTKRTRGIIVPTLPWERRAS